MNRDFPHDSQVAGIFALFRRFFKTSEGADWLPPARAPRTTMIEELIWRFSVASGRISPVDSASTRDNGTFHAGEGGGWAPACASCWPIYQGFTTAHRPGRVPRPFSKVPCGHQQPDSQVQRPCCAHQSVDTPRNPERADVPDGAPSHVLIAPFS